MAEQKFEVKGTFKIGDDWKSYTKIRMYITINGITPVDGE